MSHLSQKELDLFTNKILRQVSSEEVKLITENAVHYQDNWKKYSK